MSSTSLKITDRRRLGWLAAGMLFFLLSSSAWALDLDRSIQAQESESAQISSTLGHSQLVTSKKSSQTSGSKVHLALFKRTHKRHS